MPNYLTRQDVDQYGVDLLGASQRAALDVISPHLQQLQADNANLREHLAVASRHVLDQQVEKAVPDFREVDQDPRWHSWLLGTDVLSGRVRQALLDDAIRSGNAHRIARFFETFRQQAGRAPAATTAGHASGHARTYTPEQIKQLYAQHQRGAYAGRESQWQQIEADIFAAQKDGRVQMHPYQTK